MKASVGLYESRFVDLDKVVGVTSDSNDISFAQHVADDAVTLVRDNGRTLPLERTSTGKHKLVVVLLAEAFEAGSGHELEKAVKVRNPDAQVFHFDGRLSTGLVPEVLSAANDAQEIVIGAYVMLRAARQINFNGASTSFFGLAGPSGRLFREIITKYPDKTAVIALGSPYLIESFPQIQTYICTYAMATTSEVSAVKALFGEIQNHAKLPVTLPSVAPRGFSLPWPTQLPHPVSAEAAQ
jgi:hypothetical protein